MNGPKFPQCGNTNAFNQTEASEGAKLKRKPCTNAECVKFGSGGFNCDNPYGDYVPTCGGNCFQYSTFDWLDLTDGIIYSTDCTAFWDSNCSNQMQSVGEGCYLLQGSANSMKCYYNC